MKKICSRCGKVVGRSSECDCLKKVRRVKPTQVVKEGEDLIYKYKYKWWKLREEIIKRATEWNYEHWEKHLEYVRKSKEKKAGGSK